MTVENERVTNAENAVSRVIDVEQHSHRKPHVSFAMTLWLVGIWLIVFSDISWLVGLSGLLFAILVQVLLPMPTHPHLWHFRFGYAIALAARFIWDLVVAGVQVSWLVLSGKNHDDGIVECRLKSDNPVYMTIVAAMCSMVPGTVVLKVAPRQRRMYLHALNLPTHGGPDGIRRSVAEQEKRVLLAVATNRTVLEAGYGKYLPLASRQEARLSKRKQSSQKEGES